MFNEALNFAKTKVDNTNQEMSIIMQSRNTLLFNKNKPWAKKSGNEEFDVLMGYFDGAELCEIIGIYILMKLQSVLLKDSEGSIEMMDYELQKNYQGLKWKRNRKQIIENSKRLGLSITIKMNLNVADFLDIQFKLKTNSYKYMKPNSVPVYINKNSNPPHVLRELQKTIEKRISNISSSNEIFDNSKTIYENTLKKSGF